MNKITEEKTNSGSTTLFRPLARKKQQLTSDECIEVLTDETRGVLSVCGDDGYPYGMPMNHFYNADDGCIWFHCGRQLSHRTDALKRSDKVSFCVYDGGFRKDGEWALNVRSVIVFGRIEIIDDAETVIAITKKLCYKFTSDEKYIADELEGHTHRTLMLRLIPEHICGKLVNEA